MRTSLSKILIATLALLATLDPVSAETVQLFVHFTPILESELTGRISTHGLIKDSFQEGSQSWIEPNSVTEHFNISDQSSFHRSLLQSLKTLKLPFSLPGAKTVDAVVDFLEKDMPHHYAFSRFTDESLQVDLNIESGEITNIEWIDRNHFEGMQRRHLDLPEIPGNPLDFLDELSNRKHRADIVKAYGVPFYYFSGLEDHGIRMTLYSGGNDESSKWKLRVEEFKKDLTLSL